MLFYCEELCTTEAVGRTVHGKSSASHATVTTQFPGGVVRLERALVNPLVSGDGGARGPILSQQKPRGRRFAWLSCATITTACQNDGRPNLEPGFKSTRALRVEEANIAAREPYK